MSYNNGLSFGYDEIDASPINQYFDLSVDDPKQISKVEKVLTPQKYMLNVDQRRNLSYQDNNADTRRYPSYGNSQKSLQAVQNEMARNDIMHNIENHYVGNDETYPFNYYNSIPPKNHPFINLNPEYQHSESCKCNACTQSKSVITNNTLDQLKHSLDELQKKNDVLLITLICIIVYFVIQYCKIGTPALPLASIQLVSSATPTTIPIAPPAPPMPQAPPAPAQPASS